MGNKFYDDTFACGNCNWGDCAYTCTGCLYRSGVSSATVGRGAAVHMRGRWMLSTHAALG
jgi:hypothetical protein